MPIWKSFFDEEFEEEYKGEQVPWKVVVANEGVLFYHGQDREGWTLAHTLTHAEFAHAPPSRIRELPELHRRVSAVSYAVARGEPLPGAEEDDEGFWSRLKAAWAELVEPEPPSPLEESDAPGPASYREQASVPTRAKHNPAINTWDVELITAHLDAGWALERLDVRGRSALWAAADVTGHEELVDRLLSAGADPSNPSNTPPLLRACYRANAEKVRSLLRRGADPNAAYESGNGALQVLLALGVTNLEETEAILKTLLDAGADPNGQSSEQRSPLGCAALYSKPTLCAALLDAGANIEACNYFGTALMEAGRRDVVRLLLDHGADLHAVDENGRTALSYACESGSPGAVEELLNAGAVLAHQDHKGVSPLAEAKKRSVGGAAILEVLAAAGST